MAKGNRKPNWLFYGGWVVLSSVSFYIAWNVAIVIMSQIIRVVGDRIIVDGQSHITEDFLLLYILLPVLGLATGILQYLLIRQYPPRMGWWIAATLLGWILFLIPMRSSVFISSVVPATIAVWFIGIFVALPQWWLLRQHVNRAALWILSSILGWGVAFLLTDGAISNDLEILSVVLIPPIAGSIAWWLLLDKLPSRGKTSPA